MKRNYATVVPCMRTNQQVIWDNAQKMNRSILRQSASVGTSVSISSSLVTQQQQHQRRRRDLRFIEVNIRLMYDVNKSSILYPYKQFTRTLAPRELKLVLDQPRCWQTSHKPCQTTDLLFRQEAELSPSDHAMCLVSSSLANYHATVQKLLIRQVLKKPMVWSWRFSWRQCVINKPTTVESCISSVYRRLAVARFFKVHNVEIAHVTLTTPT